MRQLKNYLSRIQSMETILLLSSTPEFEELALWLVNMRKAKRIYRDLNELPDAENHVDAVIFDYGCGMQYIKLQGIKPGLIIGRMKREEDYFSLWEACNKYALSIYIEYESDEKKVEILEWSRRSTNIELSIVIPVYNVAAFLSECIETLTEWKAPYVEYILVNDGSTDNSRDVILTYAEKDRRIRLIDQENRGCAAARNRGIGEAAGRYIGFVDSDDFIDESMFRKLMRRVLMGNYDLAYCGYNEYYQNAKKTEHVLNDCLDKPYTEGTYRADHVQLLAIKTRVALWRCIYKKEILEQKGIRFHEDLKRFDDLPFRIEYLFAAKSSVCVPEYLYYYRLGRKGQDVACTDQRLFVHFDIFEHLDKYVSAYKDRRLQDLLQVVKIQTHGFGLSKIDKPYRKEYLRKAIRQLDRNMGYFRTICLIMMYTGKGNLGWYTGGKLRNAIFS